MKKKKSFLAAVLSLAVLLMLPTVSGIFAYLTDKAEDMWNPFTIALDATTTIIEKYPPPEDPNPNTPVPEGNLIKYEKAVQIGNTGYIDCYVRVKLEFSEQDIKNKTMFSWDGKNFYSFADYPNHLSPGWTYNANDGYFYYKPVLVAEGWEDLEKRLVFDKLWGQHYYPVNETEIIEGVCITTPLIRYVKTEFDNPEDMRSYDLYIYEEGVPFYYGNDYADAWANYLEEVEEIRADKMKDI